MNLRNRAGTYLLQPGGFRAFVPKPLPPDPPIRIDDAMTVAVSEAARRLGELASVVRFVPNPDRFIAMYVRQEAVLSSKIEGTQSTIADLLEAEEEGFPRNDDVREVANYVNAMNAGLDRLAKLPISQRLLCEVQAVLVKDVRGGEPIKRPGELRASQNWIGGSSPGNATFVPPPVAEMKQAMGDLDRFLNAESPRPLLIDIGLAHAQFETIHPFLDGNGRVGRLLITFMLVARDFLPRPLLYLSHHFRRNQDEYYSRLQAVRTEGDWEGWVLFFLRGVEAVAREATERANQIVQVVDNSRGLILNETTGNRASLALRIMDLFVQRPILTSQVIQQVLGKTQPTIDGQLRDLCRLGILKSGAKRPRRYRFEPYLRLFA